MLTCAIFPIQNQIACLKLLSHLISKYFPCISRLLTMRMKPKHICIVSPHSEMFAWSINMFFCLYAEHVPLQIEISKVYTTD
jgi:hypothetical protein